jgi:hypothetical protein
LNPWALEHDKERLKRSKSNLQKFESLRRWPARWNNPPERLSVDSSVSAPTSLGNKTTDSDISTNGFVLSSAMFHTIGRIIS